MTDSFTLDPDGDNISWIAYYDISNYVTDENYNKNDLNNPTHAGTNNEHSNGVQFTYTSPYVDRDFVIRAGNDKWITAHMTKKDTYTQDSKTDISQFNDMESYDYSFKDLKGDYDIMPWDVNHRTNAADINQNTLYLAIKDCLDQSSFWDSSNYDPNDLGLNNYKFNNPKVSIFSSTNTSNTFTFTYTDTTTIKKAYTVASLYTNWSSGYVGGYDVKYYLMGNNIVSLTYYSSTGYKQTYCAFDITEIVRNNDEIDITLSRGSSLNGVRKASVYTIVIWE